MLLPYDLFYKIIKHTDLKTILQLYHVDQSIRHICLSDPFTAILVKFSDNKYFNLDACSQRLISFLNDITGNDVNMLKKLQHSFGSWLSNNVKNIIVLEGSMNGKSTFLRLLGRLFDINYVCTSISPYYKKYDNLDLVEIPVYKNSDLYDLYDIPEQLLNFNIYQINFNIIIVHNNPITLKHDCTIFKFKSDYVYIPFMYDQLLLDTNTLPAFLNFLLQGCKQRLRK